MNRISLCLNILILVYLNCDLYHARDMSSDEVRLKSDTIAVDKCIHYIERLRQKSPIPGLVVGVGRKGKPIWVEGFGQSDVENELKTRPDSIWRLASISKSLTSALVGHLIDKGLLSMNDTIDKYLSEEIFPTKTWNNTKVSITVSQLMSHTAGLRVTQFPNDFYEVRGYKNAIQSIAQFKDCPLISAPGSEWHYSNYGFQVLGAVIESVLKNTTYEQAINQMFAELGMKSTFAENQKRMIPHRARYYIRSDSDYLKNNSDLWNNRTISVMPALVADDIWSQNSWLTSAGIVSKAEDLIRFGTYMIASFKGNNSLDFGLPLLKSSTVKKLWEPVADEPLDCDNNASAKYAHGWGVWIPDEPYKCEDSDRCEMPAITRIYYHSGGMSGVTTMLLVVPDQDMVVTTLTNTNPVSEILDLVLFLTKSFII